MNTDLDLHCSRDLRPLARALERNGVYRLQVSKDPDQSWWATFEADTTSRAPSTHIRRLLSAIEALSPSERKVWDRCDLRQFDVGYECGDTPRYFNQLLPLSLLRRMSALGLDMRITLYADELRERNARKRATGSGSS